MSEVISSKVEAIRDICRSCEGNSVGLPEGHDLWCFNCKGAGKVVTVVEYITRKCEACSGTGVSTLPLAMTGGSEKCVICRGSGQVKTTKVLATIPYRRSLKEWRLPN